MIKIENEKLEVLKDLNSAALKIALYLKSKEENEFVFCSNDEQVQSQGDPYWHTAASNLIAFLILLLNDMSSKTTNYRNMVNLRKLIANTNNKIVFAQRSASAQDWAEMFGTKTKKYYTQSEDAEGMGVQGYNARLGEAFIVHPNKIKELPIGQCYFLSKEKNVIIRDRVQVPIFS